MQSTRRFLIAFCAVGFAASLLAAAPNGSALDLRGNPQNPFSSNARVRVLLFVRSDCPITNRYAPELQRISQEFKARGVEFWMVYPDASETASAIETHLGQYHFPGTPLLDPRHELVKRAHATVAPEAAVFNAAGELVYHGRIDDRYVDIGKARPEPQVHDLEDAIAAVLSGKPVARAETRAVGCSLADVE